MPLTRHHIIPRSKGGAGLINNITMVCRPCHDELDIQAGVRQVRKRNPQRHSKRECSQCRNLIANRLKLAGVTLCQKHQWEKENQEWRESREKYLRDMAKMFGNKKSELGVSQYPEYPGTVQ